MTQMALSTSFRNQLSELSEDFAKEEQDFSIHRGAMDFIVDANQRFHPV